MRATFSRAVTSRWADTGRSCLGPRCPSAPPREAPTSMTHAESTVDDGGGVRAAVNATTTCAPAARSADAAAASVAPVVATSSTTSTHARHGPARDEPRAPAAGVAGEPGLRRGRGGGRGGRRTRATARPAGDRPGEQLGGVEAPLPATVAAGGRPGDDRRAARRAAAGTAATMRPGEPGHDRAHVAVLDPGHQLTGGALVGEGGPPGVDPRGRRGRHRRPAARRRQRVHTGAPGAPAAGARQREQDLEHPATLRPGYDSSWRSVGSRNSADATDGNCDAMAHAGAVGTTTRRMTPDECLRELGTVDRRQPRPRPRPHRPAGSTASWWGC